MDEIIVSPQNRQVLECRKLRQKKYRTLSGKYLAEGLRLAEEAVRSGLAETLFLRESFGNPGTARERRLLEWAEASGCQRRVADARVFADLAQTQSPQGVVAVVRKRLTRLDDLRTKDLGTKDLETEDLETEDLGTKDLETEDLGTKDLGTEDLGTEDLGTEDLGTEDLGTEDLDTGDGAVLLILDGVRDPGNLGTMLRTAWAVGARGVLCLPNTADPYESKCVRASMGGIFHVPVLTGVTWDAVKEFCLGEGFALAAADAAANISYYGMRWPSKTALCIGNEAGGFEMISRSETAFQVRIPLRKGAESLNAAVACGILLYEIRRNRLSGN